MKLDPILASIRAIVRKHVPDPSYKVFLFGSRPAGFARKFSDYDIGILGDQPVRATKLGDIKEELEESNIPYVVDVVDFFRVDDSFKELAMQHTQALI